MVSSNKPCIIIENLDVLLNNGHITALPGTSHAKEQQLLRPGESGFYIVQL